MNEREATAQQTAGQQTAPAIVVSAMTKAGEQFMKQLLVKGLPFMAVTNSVAERQQLAKLGVGSILLVNTIDPDTWERPERPVGKAFLFESSLSLCCRYLRMIRKWTDQPVYVVTGRTHGRLIYKGLGADHILHVQTGGLGSLLE
ncbi:hypothetical protein SAMN02799624_06243 [Paenibacillus sp. UNC496MF]|uniref:hypothetical protein n=1 Tax=Paenibacillus sp. UNC496MF TaxID=1502753 RepID=UPI0008EA8A3B|nr:hypothetical protein [Paenibacillus sp. UNC496MF]SFJ84211.1 hypothetical protein SAMN02799624_06243 [Paenibacillus sp. UNC496MF]